MMLKTKRFCVALSLALCTLIPAAKGQSSFPTQGLHTGTPQAHAFVNCTLVPGPGQKIEGATLIIRDGIVENLGKNSTIPNGYQVHDLKGAWVFPGFIDAYTTYGLKKESGRPGGFGAPPRYTASTPGPFAWNDAVRPQVDAAEEIDHEPKKAQEWMEAGITTVLSLPDDGIFRGSGTLLHLRDGAVRDVIFRAKAAAGLSFRKGSSQQSYPESLMGAIALLRQTFLDVAWYSQVRQMRQTMPGMKPLETNLALEALEAQLSARLPLVFECGGWQDVLRAARVAEEAKVKFIYKVGHDAYERVPALRDLGASYLLPLDFPEAYEIADVAEARDIPYDKLAEWENAPRAGALFAKAKVPFAYTTAGLKKPKQLWESLARAIREGLSADEALAALTIAPATLLGVDNQLGSLAPGKVASFVIYEENPFLTCEPVIFETWSAGVRHAVVPMPEVDPRATYQLQLEGRNLTLIVAGSLAAPKARLIMGQDTLKADFAIDRRDLRLSFPEGKGKEASYRLNGIYSALRLEGTGQRPDGQRINWSADRSGPATPDPREKEKKPIEPDSLRQPATVRLPQSGLGRAALPPTGTWIIRNVTVWTNTDQAVQAGWDVVIAEGKVQAVGKSLPKPPGAAEIDGQGRHLTPGIIDEHSHIAIQQGVNEGTHAITSEVRIGDVLDSKDIDIYRQLAGGVTAAQLLHGSANPIGGQSQIIKLRWGMLPEELKFKEAPGFIKFALGENVKQANWGDQYRTRYPQTREGVEQFIKDCFQSALDYRKAQAESAKGIGNTPPFRRDLQLETVLEILDGKRFITCHSYVQSEILMLMRLAESFGFRVNTFTHVLEGYKVARELKAHGASASTFSDWWAYKMEVNDAIPHNAALLHAQGVNVCINSDDNEMARRLNQEAAKAVKYGGVSEVEALKMVTLNPAKALHVEQYVGSVAPGKVADLVLWSDHPLSVYAQAEMTFVDGRCYFDRKEDQAARTWLAQERTRILAKMMASPGKEKRKVTGKEAPELQHCETIENDYNHE
jgi:imidazolonepropionase-like amidohydrolase